MVRLKLQQEIQCGLEAFWRDFFDANLTARLHREGLGFRDYQTIAFEDRADKITRTILAEPTLLDLGAAGKILGSAAFRYREQGSFDRASHTWRWTMIPGALAEKTRVVGKMTVTPLGEHRVRRDVEIEIEASVFGIGGMIEDAYAKQLRKGWEEAARVQNEWLKAQPPQR